MVSGIPTYPKNAMDNIEDMINRYWELFSRYEYDLNFSANKGSSEFSSQAITMLSPQMKKGFRMVGVRFKLSCSTTKANPIIKIVMAGVGTPINESVCRVSTLNLAKRMADAMVYNQWEIGKGRECIRG